MNQFVKNQEVVASGGGNFSMTSLASVLFGMDEREDRLCDECKKWPCNCEDR